MFTGLIQAVGRVSGVYPVGDAMRYEIEATELSGSLIDGESVAVDGCCLTVEKHNQSSFTAFASPETLSRSTLGVALVGRAVNLERALALGDRLGGHLVSGHVDGMGRFAEAKRTAGGAYDLYVQIPHELSEQVIPKGSIAIDGVSLTIARIEGQTVCVAVIPETWSRTSLKFKKAGDGVNVETDMIGKYVIHYLKGAGAAQNASSPLTLEKMMEAGF